MKKIFLVMLMLLALPVVASHIVGGEFEIVYVSGNTYRVNLILYFDDKNGEEGAKDLNVSARIFRKSDNVFMRDVFLPLVSTTPVSYTQPDCSKGEIKTSKRVYSTTITMNDSQYNDPQGYYIVWERCCRNYTITNIISQKPDTGVILDPLAAGQAFYLEFPPVVKDGEPFINSTPQLFPPLNDYACPNKFYYADFAGTDKDGDSLVYTLVTPLNTHTAEALPPAGPAPAPFPEVLWRSPFSLTNILAGKPDLKVSPDGLLTATPTLSGLFVFSVKCEEFRDGIKLGEVRRDFQLLVVDQCSDAVPPQILGKKLGDTDFTYDENMSVTFNAATQDADRCIEVRISDKDVNRVADTLKEVIHIKAIPLGFKKDVSGILPSIKTFVLTQKDSIKIFKVCFSDCPFIEGPFTVGIVAFDDACSLPLFDTLKVLVNMPVPANNNAQFLSPDINETVAEGSPIKTWILDAEDIDGDIMDFTIIPGPGTNLAQAGMTYEILPQTGDQRSVKFSWDPRCDIFNFTKKTEFSLRIRVEDNDYCGFDHPDFLNIKLKIVLPVNYKPLVSSPELTGGKATINVVNLERKVNELLVFNVNGFDADNDNLTLVGSGKDFTLSEYGITFPQASGKGNVNSLFTWNIACAKLNLPQKNKFTFQFLLTDYENKCRFPNSDTLIVNVTVKPPDNVAPALAVTNLNEQLTLSSANKLNVTLGQDINLALLGTDADKYPQADLLTMELVSATGNVQPTGYSFTSTEARGIVPGTFTWDPSCEIFQKGIYENDYTFTFLVRDDKCFNAKGDTLTVDIKIKDIDGSDTNFIPPNIVTPNNDEKNDFFAMVKSDPATGELTSILPLDNCQGFFKKVIIFNRWGRNVFESSDRDFKWFANGESTGVYFYHLQYSNKAYRGSVTVSYFDN